MPAVNITSMIVPTHGDQGATLNLSAQAESTTNGTLTYLWDFGGGVTSAGASVSRSFGAAATRSVHLVVSDGTDQADQTESLVIDNVAPTVSLDSALASLYEGDSLPFAASPADAGGTDDPLTVVWDFHYNGTTFQADSQAGGSLQPTNAFPI